MGIRYQKVDLAIYVGVITALIGWGVSVENRLAKEAEALNLSNRIRAMEELMLPMLIDWKTHKELKKWQQENIEKVRGQVNRPGGSKPSPTKPAAVDEVPDTVRQNVDKWAQNVFKGQPEKQSQSRRLIPVNDPLPTSDNPSP